MTPAPGADDHGTGTGPRGPVLATCRETVGRRLRAGNGTTRTSDSVNSGSSQRRSSACPPGVGLRRSCTTATARATSPPMQPRRFAAMGVGPMRVVGHSMAASTPFGPGDRPTRALRGPVSIDSEGSRRHCPSRPEYSAASGVTDSVDPSNDTGRPYREPLRRLIMTALPKSSHATRQRIANPARRALPAAVISLGLASCATASRDSTGPVEGRPGSSWRCRVIA